MGRLNESTGPTASGHGIHSPHVAVRWLVENGYGPAEQYPEVAVLRSHRGRRAGVRSLSRVSEGYVHPKTNGCSPVNSQLGAGHDRRPGPVDPVDNDRMHCSAGADRWHSLLPSYAPGLVELHGQPGWVAALTPLSVDGMIVAASTTLLARFSVGTQRWSIAVGTSGREQRRQPPSPALSRSMAG